MVGWSVRGGLAGWKVGACECGLVGCGLCLGFASWWFAGWLAGKFAVGGLVGGWVVWLFCWLDGGSEDR